MQHNGTDSFQDDTWYPGVKSISLFLVGILWPGSPAAARSHKRAILCGVLSKRLSPHHACNNVVLTDYPPGSPNPLPSALRSITAVWETCLKTTPKLAWELHVSLWILWTILISQEVVVVVVKSLSGFWFKVLVDYQWGKQHDCLLNFCLSWKVITTKPKLYLCFPRCLYDSILRPLYFLDLLL